MGLLLLVGATLPSALLKGGAVLAVALLITGLPWRQDPAWRRAVLVAALVLQAVLVLLAVGAPSWRLRVLPARVPVAVEGVPQTARAASPLATAAIRSEGGDAEGAVATTPGGMPWPAALWLAGVVLLALRAVRITWWSTAVSRTAMPPHPALQRLLDEVVDAAGLRSPPALMLSDRADVPFVRGWLRPMVVLPVAANQWCERDARAVLSHEVAHLAGRDGLPHRIARVAAVLAWPSPLVHLAVRRLREMLERGADLHVLRLGLSAPDYAEGVVGALRATRRRNPIAALAISNGTGRLARRMRLVLEADPAHVRTGARARAEFGIALGILGGVAVGGLAARIPPVTGAVTGCDWNGGRHLDRTRRLADGRPEWSVAWEGTECRVTWRTVGTVLIDPVAGTVQPASVADSAVLRVEGAHPRTFAVTRDPDGRVTRTAPAWLPAFLVELDRHTAFALEDRLPRLYAAGGATAVIGEARRSQGGHAGGMYLVAAIARGMIPTGHLPEALEVADRVVAVEAVRWDLVDAVVTAFDPIPEPIQPALRRLAAGLRTSASREALARLLPISD